MRRRKYDLLLRAQQLSDGWYGIFTAADSFDKWIGPFATKRAAITAAVKARRAVGGYRRR